jgi:hypothetical protein
VSPELHGPFTLGASVQFRSPSGRLISGSFMRWLGGRRKLWPIVRFMLFTVAGRAATRISAVAISLPFYSPV